MLSIGELEDIEESSKPVVLKLEMSLSGPSWKFDKAWIAGLYSRISDPADLE